MMGVCLDKGVAEWRVLERSGYSHTDFDCSHTDFYYSHTRECTTYASKSIGMPLCVF